MSWQAENDMINIYSSVTEISVAQFLFVKVFREAWARSKGSQCFIDCIKWVYDQLRFRLSLQ